MIIMAGSNQGEYFEAPARDVFGVPAKELKDIT